VGVCGCCGDRVTVVAIVVTALPWLPLWSPRYRGCHCGDRVTVVAIVVTALPWLPFSAGRLVWLLERARLAEISHLVKNRLAVPAILLIQNVHRNRPIRSHFIWKTHLKSQPDSQDRHVGTVGRESRKARTLISLAKPFYCFPTRHQQLAVSSSLQSIAAGCQPYRVLS
jgi:hypothetical protein